MTTQDSLVSQTVKNFYGTFVILPGQFIHLDNQYVQLTPTSLKIIFGGNPDKIFEYNIAEIRLLRFTGSILPVLQVRVSGLAKYNITPVDDTDNLLVDVLDMRAPNIFYLSYDPQLNYYTLKNSSMSTLFIMEKAHE
jgi:hypothetical protein